MKKFILPIVMVLGITIILGFVSAQDTASCTDSDGGINKYQKGRALTSTEAGDDQCLGQYLWEYSCDNGQIKKTEIECNCNDGVCYDSSTCTDTENPNVNTWFQDKYTKGTVKVVYKNNVSNREDVSIDECNEEGKLVDYSCSPSGNSNYVGVGFGSYIECGNYGCNNGRCLKSEDVERVTCEIDYGTTMSSDAKCKVKYNNKNAECTIKADSDPYNICYPEPAIYIAKPTPDEGYMNVQGLSGTFEGISCSKIETAYNTNGFFVNCKPGKPISEVYNILIKGKLVDQITGEPVSGAELISAYEFSPSKVITDDNGNFQFTVSSDFKLKEGPEIGKSDIGAQWTFFTRCYDYAYIVLQRNYNGYSIALRETVFDQDEKVKDVSNQKTIDLGNLKIYPNADISIESDIATSFSVMYQYKNRQGYNGPGQSGYTKEHYLSSALPLTYDVFIQFQDEAGTEYKSSVYTTPLEARCGVVSLKYNDGESQWSILSEVKPTEETGPIKIDVPEGVKKGNPEVISNICFGCLKSETCYPLGYRKSGEFCSESKTFIIQLEADSTCDNNFECTSNVCVSGKCISESLIQRILNWFKRLFGGS